MENQASPRFSTRHVQQIVDPNDFGISLRPVQQIIDPNDFTLFGSVEDCSPDRNVPKIQSKVEEDNLAKVEEAKGKLRGIIDRATSKSSVQCISETSKSDLLTTPVENAESVPAKPSEVINPGEELKKSNAFVSLDANHGSKKDSSDLINILNKESKNIASFSEPLPNLRGEVTGEQSPKKHGNSISAEYSSLSALLTCDRLLPAPSTSNDGQTNQATSTKTPDNITSPPRVVIKFRSCTLLPRKAGSFHPVSKDKPPGCKTIKVTLLPDSASEKMIREMFEKFGKIVNLSMEKMCYLVRFEQASAVDSAVSLSGCMFVGGNRGPSHRQMLIVDYAKSKEDQLEWESQQRKLQIEDHPTTIEKTGQSSSSPAVYCTESDIAKASEMIKRNDRFLEAVQLLSRWLEMEDYDTKNSDKIYSMIQETNAHAIRLLTEKKRQYEEMKRFRNQCRGKAEVISSQRPKDKWTDRSSSTDGTSENAAGNFSQTKKARSRTRSSTSRFKLLVGTDSHSSVPASEIQSPKSEAGHQVATSHRFEVPSQVQPLASETEHPAGTSSHSSGLTSQIQPPISQTEYLGGTGHISGPASQIYPTTSQIGHSVGTTFQSSGEASEIHHLSSQILPQSSQIQPHPSEIQPQSSEIQPQSSQIQPQSSQIQPQSPQIQHQSPHIEEQVPNIELRTNGLASFAEEVRLSKLLKIFPSSSKWSPQLLRRLQEICVFRNKNSLYLEASKRSSMRVVVPLVSDEEREIYKHTVTIPKKYPEENWLRRSGNSEESASDIISETTYYPFSNQKKTVQFPISPASPTSDGTPQKACEITENMPDGAFKTPKDFPRPKKILKAEAEEEDRLARIVSYFPNPSQWSFALQARLRFFKQYKSPHLKQQFFLRMLDGKEVKVYLPRLRSRKMARLNASVIPNKYPEEYALDKVFGEGTQENYSNADLSIAGNSSLHTSTITTLPELSKAHLETPNTSISLKSRTSPEEATIEEPIGLTSTTLKASGENSITSSNLLESQQSKKYEDNQPSNEFRTLQPQIPYRKPPVLIIQQDQHNPSSKKRHCLEDPEEPLAKVKKISPDESEDAKHSEAETPLLDETIDNKVSEVPKSSNKLPSKPGGSRIADDKANNQDENTGRDVERKFPGSGKSDGECLQNIAKLDITEDKKLQQSTKSSVHSQSSKKNKINYTEPVGEGSKLGDINTREKVSRDSKKSHRSSKEFKKNRQKTTDNKRTSSVKDESKEREYKNFASSAKHSYREKETVDELFGDGLTKKHRSSKSKDIKIPSRELPKNKDETLSADSTKTQLDKAKVSSDSSKSLSKHFGQSKNPTSDAEAKPSGSLESSNRESCNGPHSHKNDPERRTVENPVRSTKELGEKLQKLFNSSNESVTDNSQENCSKQESTQSENVTKDLKDCALEKSNKIEEFVEDATKDSADDHISQEVENSGTSSSSSKHSQNISKNEDENVPKDLGGKSPKDYLVSKKKIISVDAREKSCAVKKSNEIEEFVKDTIKGSADDHIPEAVENSGTSSGSSKHSRNISKNEGENVPKDLVEKSPKDYLVSKKKIISVDAREKIGALEKSNKREEFVRDTNKSSADDHISQAVGNSGTSSGSSKHSRDISKNEDENVPKDLVEKSPKDSLVSKKKIISSDTTEKIDALEKSNKREEFVEDTDKGTPDDHISQAVEKSGTSSGSSKYSRNISKNEDENVPKDLVEKSPKDYLISKKKIISSDTREKIDAVEKSNKRQDFVKDTNKGSPDDHISQAAENSGTSSGSSKYSRHISKNEVENVPKDLVEKSPKDYLVSKKKIISSDTREKIDAVEKSNKRQEFVKDTNKGSPDDHISQAAENSGTSSGSSKYSRHISKNEDENVPKDLVEKSPKDYLVSKKKIISSDTREKIDAVEKSSKRQEFVKDTNKGSPDDHISQAAENSGTSSGSSKRSRNISKDEDGVSKDAEQESGKNFDQKCEEFRKKYLAFSKRKPSNTLGGKGLDNEVPNQEQNENPTVSMTFAEFLSSQQRKDPMDGKDLAKKPENNDEKQMPIESRSSSEKVRKRCSVREDLFAKEPEASTSKKSATEGHWEDVMQSLDYVPKKRPKPIKLSQNSQLKENVGKRALETPVKSSKPLELSQNSHQIKKKICRSPTKPNTFPKIRIKNHEKIIRPSGWQNSSKLKEKTSISGNKKSADAEESSKKTTGDSLKVSVEKTAQQQSKQRRNEDPGVSLINQAMDMETQELRNPTKDIDEIERLIKSVPHVDQGTEPPPPKIKAEICGPEKEVKEEKLELQFNIDEPKLEKIKKDLPDNDESEHIYEASSKNAQDLRNQLQLLFEDVEEPEELEDASETAEKLYDYYCDTYLSSEDILKLSGEVPDIKFVE